MNKISFFTLLLLALLSACTAKETPVPRPTAYPRAAQLPDSTVAVAVGGLESQVNINATSEQPTAGWLDIEYPQLGATTHITVRRPASPAEVEQAIENRRERIRLNLDGRTAEVFTFTTPQGFECELTVSIDGAPTPVQFLGVSPDGFVVSGATVLQGAWEPADSIAPIKDALQRQALIFLQNLNKP